MEDSFDEDEDAEDESYGASKEHFNNSRVKKTK
jgi:hypothetical protein